MSTERLMMTADNPAVCESGGFSIVLAKTLEDGFADVKHPSGWVKRYDL